MSSTESKLMWGAIVVSLLLVMVLGTLAVYSVLGREETESAATDGVAQDGADTGQTDLVTGQTDTQIGERPPAGPDLVIADVDPPATVACGPSPVSDQDFRVLITNRSDETIDYLVSIELAVAGASPLVATAAVPSLEPDRPREVTVTATGLAGRRITGCSIAAVQSDRRVLLANS